MRDQKARGIIAVARDIFARHGYRRVNMKEIAEAAGISRPGLYLYFKTKEEVFSAAVAQLAEDAIGRIQSGLPRQNTAEDKLLYAFEIFAVEIFDLTLQSPEAKELSECSFEFARTALDEGYRQFEAVLCAILKAHAKSRGSRLVPPAERMAHLMGSAVRGFKLEARNAGELRGMIRDLIKMTGVAESR